MADKKRNPRRRLWIILALIGSFLLYGYAVQETDVDLAEVQSETRRASLVRIMRNLARPNLIEYDSEEVTISADILVPCPDGATGPQTDTSAEIYLIVEPSCVNPGETVTITGVGFAAASSGMTEFRPDSEFNVTRTLEPFIPDADGNFTVTAEIPNRTSEQLQQIEATTRVQRGSWLNRQVVWTDLNNNGVRDEQAMPDTGTLVMEVPDLPTIPGAGLVLVIDDEVIQTYALGDDFVGANGPAEGIAMSAGTIAESELRIDSADQTGQIAISGPAGTNLNQAQVLLYGPDSGNREGTYFVADRFAHSPRLSDNAMDTWDKILETVFMAFLATTLGLLIALPMSFLAARNLMKDIRTTVTNLSLNLLAIPIGGLIGLYLTRWARTWTNNLDNDWLRFVLVMLIPIGLLYTLRAILKEEDAEAPTSRERTVQTAVFIAAGFVVAIWGFILGALLENVGASLGWGFIGNFIAIIGEVIRLLLPVFAIMGAIGMMMNFGSKLGFALNDRLDGAALRGSQPAVGRGCRSHHRHDAWGDHRLVLPVRESVD